MPRRKVIAKREIAPDPKHGSVQVARFINQVMVRGKKSIAEAVVYGALDKVQHSLKRDPVEALNEALEHVAPVVEVKSRRVGGATYQVPVEVRESRRVALAMRWMVDFARKRSEKNMPERLAGEIMDAVAGRGATIKRREDMHRMAEANKAFAHYRF